MEMFKYISTIHVYHTAGHNSVAWWKRDGLETKELQRQCIPFPNFVGTLEWWQSSPQKGSRNFVPSSRCEIKIFLIKMYSSNPVMIMSISVLKHDDIENYRMFLTLLANIWDRTRFSYLLRPYIIIKTKEAHMCSSFLSLYYQPMGSWMNIY